MPTPSRSAAPLAVLLFNPGGPATLADVDPFLINLLAQIVERHLGGTVDGRAQAAGTSATRTATHGAR